LARGCCGAGDIIVQRSMSYGSTEVWEGYLGWKDSPQNYPPFCAPAMTWTNAHQGTGGMSVSSGP